MTESTEPHPEKDKNWISTLFKVTFFITAFVLVIFTVMANMGGAGDTLKSATEEFITDMTGYQTTISVFNRMNFFPTMSLDMEDVSLRRDADDYDPVITVGRIDLAMGFWDVTFNTGNIRKFDIENFSALPGVLLENPVGIQSIGITEDQGDLAFLEGRGTIGPYPLSFQADMVASGPARKRKYSFAKKYPVVFSVGEIGLEGQVVRSGNNISLRDLIISAPQKVLNGSFSFSVAQEKNLRVRGDVELESGSKINIDLTVVRDGALRQVTGKITAPVLHQEDLAPGQKLAALCAKLRDVFGWPLNPDGTLDISHFDLAIDVDAANFVVGSQSKGPLKARIAAADSKIDWGALSPAVAKK